MSTLRILSGGAVEGLTNALAPIFKSATGWDIEGEFGAVGKMADKLRAGTYTDVIILTNALINELGGSQLIEPSTQKNIGIVETAIATRVDDVPVSIESADEFRAALLSSQAIFVPDTKSSTAGIHIARTFGRLGVSVDVANRVREFPNGIAAMQNLAKSDVKRAIGLTQTTEILNTDGVILIGPFPRGLDLVTMYGAALTTATNYPKMGSVLIDLLTNDEHRSLRHRAGFG